MNVVNAKPPNFDRIAAAFPMAVRQNGVIFCYGNTIFAPGIATVSPALVMHEGVHCDRQGDNPAQWWERYITSPQFRFDEELPAHQAEYAFLRHRLGRSERKRALHQIAARLSGALYGNMVTLAKARDLIEAA